MAGRREGHLVVRQWKSGRGYALRFRAYGRRRYLTLGLESEGWTRQLAEEALANLMADVRQEIWVPPECHEGANWLGLGEKAPLFGTFAHWLISSNRGQFAERTADYLEWGVSHLTPCFGEWFLHEIDAQAVDAYRAYKVREAEMLRREIERGRAIPDGQGRPRRPLSAGSINKTIDTLGWVLGFAMEYGYMPAYQNPAQGKRRRLPVQKRPPIYLDTAEQVGALLEAARELDRTPRWLCADRKAIIATLALAGLRAHELCNLRWRDVDLANGRIRVTASKTAAGIRDVDLCPFLREVLAEHWDGASRKRSADLVFPTSTGRRRDKDNLRCRVLSAAIRQADERRSEREQPPLPKGLSPHKLRHTFASILFASGEDPVSVMAQLGHTHPGFTLRVYAHAMRRAPGERERLRALMRGTHSAGIEGNPRTSWGAEKLGAMAG